MVSMPRALLRAGCVDLTGLLEMSWIFLKRRRFSFAISLRLISQNTNAIRLPLKVVLGLTLPLSF